MKYLVLLVSLLICNMANAVNCTSGLLTTDGKNITQSEIENAIRCLQSEIDSIKLQDNDLKITTAKKVWVVQVAATTDKVYAYEVKDTFESLGYSATVRISQNTKNKKKKNWYKVHIGSYIWRSEAVSYKDYIKNTYPRYNGSFVTSAIKE